MPDREHAEVRAIAVSPLDGHLLDAFVRLTRLLDSPAEARVLQRDASQFNREYKNLFGFPPMRDIQRLREEAQNRAG